MLRSISFENYRAFRAASYPIRPVTIFLGPNSIGKTSALQLPLLLKQTASVSGHGYNSALKIHGRDVSFGDSINIFHKQDRNTPLRYTFSITDSSLHSLLTRELASELQDILNGLLRFALYQFQKQPISSQFDEKLLSAVTRKLDRPIKHFFDGASWADDFMTLRDSLVSLPDVEFSAIPVYSSRRYIGGSSGRHYRGTSTLNLKTLSKADLNRCLTYLEGLSKLTSRNFLISIEISSSKTSDTSALYVSQFSLKCVSGRDTFDVLNLDIQHSGEIKLGSDFLAFSEINAYNKTLSESIVPHADIFSFVGSQLQSNKFLFPEILRRIIFQSTYALHELFEGDGVRHIGPLRAHPKRFYFLDTAQPGSAEGDSLIEALRENQKLKAQVNEWLHRFGIDLTVRQFQEIIHRLSIKSDQNTFELDITDVGFGISQLLPILVEGFLSPPGAMIVVEQPEIHIHPKMQGDLADLFIAMSGAQKPGKSNSGTPKKFFLVETHSEYLLSRLRRRIAEGAVSHEDVAVVIAERAEDGSTILDNVGISESGNFRWPQGFQEASLDDTLAYAQAVAKQTAKHHGR